MTEEDKKILNCRARKAFLDELKHRQTRQGSFEESFLHHGHPLFGGGPVLEPSDGGDSAARIRGNCDEVPRWRTLWIRARRKLTRKQKRILDALLVDWRSRPAARLASVSQPTVDKTKKLFQKIFAQCFQAYDRDFGQK